MKTEIKINPTPEALATAAADFFRSSAQQAIAERGRFVVALSGGSTPKRLFGILSSEPYISEIDWSNCYFFFGDERYVAHDHVDSNYRMSKENLFDHIPCPAKNIFAITTNSEDADIDAKRYEQSVFEQLGKTHSFDLIYLGLGPDGHTASLFPNTSALQERTRIVVAVYVEKFESWRITFTYPLINSARHVMFLAEGDSKAEILHEILEDKNTTYPAQEIRATTALHWYLDQRAASKLKKI